MSAIQLSPSRTISHLASRLTTLAGVLFIVVPPLVELVAEAFFILMGLALLLVVAALPALRRLQSGQDGRLGRWGLRLTTAGLATMVVLVVSGNPLHAVLDDSARAVVETLYLAAAAVAALMALAGVVMYSTGMIRARVLSTTGVCMFLTGMVLALSSEAFEQSLHGPVPLLADVLPPLGFVCAGAGLVVLGRSAKRVERSMSGSAQAGELSVESAQITL